jgi:hypothetical protein
VTARSLRQINFRENLFHFSKEATRQQELMENQHKHGQIMYRFELDIGSGTAESTVESDSTLEEMFQVFIPSCLCINLFQTLSIVYIFHGVTNYFLTYVNFYLLH